LRDYYIVNSTVIAHAFPLQLHVLSQYYIRETKKHVGILRLIPANFHVLLVAQFMFSWLYL
jgi:hypothetical protein